MAKIRADFDVGGALVLPEGSTQLALRPARDIEVILRNAAPDSSGHVPRLSVSVIAEGDLMTAPNNFRELLAHQLDALSFVTNSAFVIEQCRRVIEWEPHQKRRAFRSLQKFDPLSPPNPGLMAESVGSAEAILQAPLPPYVQRAMGCFRYGLLATQLEDQFQQFWLAIETIAEGRKEIARAPIPCPTCQGPLVCENCQKQPERRPMARQSIREMIHRHCQPDPGEVYRKLIGVRDHLTHGGSPRSVDQKFGEPFASLVNIAATVAWHFIMLSLPQLGGALHTLWPENNAFANKELIAAPVGTFEFEGEGEYPPDDKIPDIKIEMKVRFSPLEDG